MVPQYCGGEGWAEGWAAQPEPGDCSKTPGLSPETTSQPLGTRFVWILYIIMPCSRSRAGHWDFGHMYTSVKPLPFSLRILPLPHTFADGLLSLPLAHVRASRTDVSFLNTLLNGTVHCAFLCDFLAQLDVLEVGSG